MISCWTLIVELFVEISEKRFLTDFPRPVKGHADYLFILFSFIFIYL